LEEQLASIFKAKEYTKQETRMKQFFGLEDGGDIFLRNIG
jgi:hypothetical protein